MLQWHFPSKIFKTFRMPKTWNLTKEKPSVYHIDSQFCLGTALLRCINLFVSILLLWKRPTSTCTCAHKKKIQENTGLKNAQDNSAVSYQKDWCTKEELKVIRNIFIWRMKCSIRGSFKKYIDNVAVEFKKCWFFSKSN